MYKKGWRLEKAVIAIYTNPFSAYRKQEGIILPNKRITATSLERRVKRLNTEDLIKGIRKISY